MATLSLFIVGLLSLLFFSPEQTAFLYSLPIGWEMFARAFTHMVSHANMQHLTGNFCFGLPYMLYLEHRMKSTKKFIRIFVGFGLVALAGQFIAGYFSVYKSSGMIGSSGAIFGMAALAMISYDGSWLYQRIFKTVMWYYFLQQGLLTLSGLNFPTGVGNAAHFSGILAAIILHWFLVPVFKKKGSRVHNSTKPVL